jgi:hypothetical protein
MKTVKAWHFLSDSGKLRDGREVEVGTWLKHSGPAVMCQSGLHASRKVTDALKYAPGSVVCRVECRDIVEEQSDKLLCRERRILWQMDATPILRAFARKCAMDVIHLWDAPDVVVRYLKTGDESLRDAARDAARAAAWAAARDAAWDAAWDAARDAAWAAAWAAARAAAWDAAWDAAWAAARAAAWDAAWDAARDAAWAAAWDAAWDAARDAAWDAARAAARAAAWAAARDAARDAAWAKQERRLTAMLNGARK